jgi:phosphohistidine swiveling domain-containing protein
MEQTWILPLDATEATLETAGGKGANLARLAREGFPVPRGFIVTTHAYRAHVAANHLGPSILAALEDLQIEDPAALAVASDAIRSRFLASVVDPDLAAALLDAYASLGGLPMAVRSSATAEDLPETSFAGQHDTFLNVEGDQALLEAVVRCWGSLWTARAIGYRARNGMPEHDLALAIVVQEMVDSEASGVLFTANPLNGKRTEMVIEATLGLGEALVSGQVEPDSYRVDAASGRILDRALGGKALSIRPRPGGGTVSQPEQATTRPALPDEAVAELARLGRQVAALLGASQDIEWAWAGGQLHLLQSRPITSLLPVPVGMAPEPLRVMLSFGAVQGILEPMTPLGRDAIRAVFAGAGGLFGYRLTAETQHVLHATAERLFIDISGLIHHRALRRVLRGAMPMLEPSVAQALETLWDDPRLAPVEGFSPHALGRLARFVLPLLGRLALSLLRPDAQRARFQRQLEAEAAVFQARMSATRSLAERVALMEEMLDRAFRFLLPRFVPRFGAGMGPLTMLTRLAASLPGDGHDALSMTRGMPHNVTTEMDLALWQVSRIIHCDAAAAARFQKAEPAALAADYLAGRLPGPAQSAIAGFLERYGMRGPGEIDLGRPRWRENPTPIMHALQGYLQIEDADQAPDTAFARGAAAASAAIGRLADSVRQTRGGWLKARLVLWAAKRMRALAGLRESPKLWAIRMMGLVRQALLDSGEELVEDRLLTQPDDLFFLHLAELKALAAGERRDWSALAQARRQTYAREQRRQRIPRLLLSDGQAFYEGMAPLAEGENVLTGSPVSPGIVEGRVRVVWDPQGAQLEPGEILVCPATDPAWTPLFLVAGGLVMEVGGLMTHGSVVAREYGIPAIVGVSQAATRLQTGQRVRLDATAGQVLIL